MNTWAGRVLRAHVGCGEVDLVCRANSDAGLWLVGPGVCRHGGGGGPEVDLQ